MQLGIEKIFLFGIGICLSTYGTYEYIQILCNSNSISLPGNYEIKGLLLYLILGFLFIQQRFIEHLLHCKQYSRSSIYYSNKPEIISSRLSQDFHCSGGGERVKK